MSALIVMNGHRFGLWTVLRENGRDRHGQAFWLCRCDCGTEKNVTGGRLRRGESRSCGCDKPRMCAEANIKHGDSARGRMTAEYRTWSNMIDRCERPGNKQYRDWGGRGIKVCQRWRESFAAFLADMGRKPSPELSIDRIDNDGNYEPGNCRWATRLVQRHNQRRERVRQVEQRALAVLGAILSDAGITAADLADAPPETEPPATSSGRGAGPRHQLGHLGARGPA